MNTTWQPLNLLERRVLGVLVEKQKTSKTADTYPLTLNALTTGCNQKSNRDPFMELREEDVAETLAHLQQAGLVCKVTGGRVDRWKHELYDRWNVNAAEMAVLAELLLRGPQSVGDLRGRADRMSPIATLDELHSILRPLAERGLVVWLSDPQRRGAMLTHGFHTPDELEQLKHVKHPGAGLGMGAAAAVTAATVHGGDGSIGSMERLRAVESELQGLKAAVEAMRAELADLRRQLAELAELRRQLGG